MDVKISTAEARTDLYPSPMPGNWNGTLTVSIVRMEGLTPVWGIKSNGAPITPRTSNADRAYTEMAAKAAITAWIDAQTSTEFVDA